MPSSGPNAAGSGTDDASIGTIAWPNPDRITADDSNPSATTDVIPTSGGATHYLVGTQFGFAISAGATITGVQCEANGSVDGNPGDVVTNSVKLVKGGTISGSDLAETNLWPFSDDGTFHSWGGDGQMWGLTLTPADVNASNFGFALSMKNTSTTQARGASMDFFRVTVFYTTPAAPQVGQFVTAHIGRARWG